MEMQVVSRKNIVNRSSLGQFLFFIINANMFANNRQNKTKNQRGAGELNTTAVRRNFSKMRSYSSNQAVKPTEEGSNKTINLQREPKSNK